MRKFVAIAISLLLFAPYAYALSLPDYTGFVNDYAAVIDDPVEIELEAALSAFEKETSHEITVVTIDSLQGVTIEEFALKLAEKWGVGKSKTDNGALLLVAPTEREVRIEVGYGLEPVLTDAVSHRIIQNVIIPHFKAGNYSAGIADASKAMMQVASGEELSEEATQLKSNIFDWILPLLMLSYFLVWMLGAGMRTMESLKSKGLVRLLMGGFAWVMGIGISAMVATVALGLVGIGGFLFDIKAHKYKDTAKDKLPWWLKMGANGGRNSNRSNWLGGGRSGSGGGGFSGFGGGGFGGGGSSGRW